jgi:hypothetical protein
MDNQRKILSRREILAMTLGLGGLAAFGGPVFAQEARRNPTPAIDLRPFYPVVRPKDLDADLTLIDGHQKARIHSLSRLQQ